MKISNFSIKRPVTTFMIMILIVVLGLVSITKLPVDLYPKMNIPYAMIITQYDGAAPQEVETIVTKSMESAVGTVSDLKNISSTSSAGRSVIALEFVSGTDMNYAMLNIREKVDLAKKYLPDNVGDPLVLKADPSMMPIMEIGISSDVMNLIELKEFIDENVKDRLEKISGVASVSISGGKDEEIQINFYPEKLLGYGLSIDTVSQILKAENLNLPAGELKQGSYNISLRTIGEFNKIDQIRNLPIPTKTGLIYMRDIADVNKGYKEMNTYSYINGRPSVNISIQKESVANTVELSKRVNKEIKKILIEFKQLKVLTVYDSADFINKSISNVMSMGLEAGIIAVIILYIFLRNMSSTMIIGISIPVSIIATFAMMYFSGLTLNMISLGGLTLGIGMLVDNSIVVLENITRHRNDDKTMKEAAAIGANEVALAIMASTLTSIAVFLPLVFTEGIVVQMFKELALTITFSLISSLLVALTIVPMLASKIMKKNQKIKIKKNIITGLLDLWEKIFEVIKREYEKILKWALKHKKITLGAAVLVFIGGIILVAFISMEAFPKTDTGQFKIEISLPYGKEIDKTFDVVDEVKERIENIEEIKNVFISVGGGGNFFTGTNSNKATVTIDIGDVDDRTKSIDDIVDYTRNKVIDIPGCEIKVSAVSSGGGMGGGSEPINLELHGDDLDQLREIGDDLVNKISEIKGTREVTHSFKDGGLEARLIINRDKASLYGLNTVTIAKSVLSNIEGSKATTFKVDGKEIDVTIKNDISNLKYIQDISSIYIKSPMGISVPVNDVAEVVVEKSPIDIGRKNKSRFINITSKLYGSDLGNVRKEIAKVLNEYEFPKSYTYKWAGDVESMVETFTSLGLALILAILFVYMVLASQFESLINPFIIMFSVPLALIGGIFGIFVTGVSLSIPGFVGFILLAGIVVNNAIVLIDYINQKRAEGVDVYEAIVEAGSVRLKPILMTTTTTVLGMLPMAMSLGSGAEVTRSLAVVVIFGLLCSTILTLIIIPTVYMVINNRKNRKKKKLLN